MVEYENAESFKKQVNLELEVWTTTRTLAYTSFGPAMCSYCIVQVGFLNLVQAFFEYI
jgi:hypothetical protein